MSSIWRSVFNVCIVDLISKEHKFPSFILSWQRFGQVYHLSIKNTAYLLHERWVWCKLAQKAIRADRQSFLQSQLAQRCTVSTCCLIFIPWGQQIISGWDSFYTLLTWQRHYKFKHGGKPPHQFALWKLCSLTVSAGWRPDGLLGREM